MQKGQVFSLDLLVAITLIILAFALLIQQFEVFQYNLKQDQLQAELQRIGLTASNLLVSNPDIACKLVDDSSKDDPLVLDYLGNCLPKQESVVQNPGVGIPLGQRKKLILKISKERLGIPAGFECNLSTQKNHSMASTDCTENFDNVPNVFSIERKLVFLKDNQTSVISKKDFDDCVKGNCAELVDDVVTLRVWKA